MMYKECEGCRSANKCSTAVQPGSVMCQMYRMQNGQAKTDLEIRKHQKGQRCPHCGRLID